MLESNMQRIVATVDETIFTAQCSPLPSCKKNYKESLHVYSKSLFRIKLFTQQRKLSRGEFLERNKPQLM